MRSFWSDVEIIELLGQVKKNNILSKLDGKTGPRRIDEG